MSENFLLEQALEYAKRGWHVLPCRPQAVLDEDGKERFKAKAPLTKNSFYDASANPDKIRKWWGQWPDALIGVATGPSGLLVIDCDNKHGIDGEANFAELAAAHGGVPPTYVVRSQSGGKHLYFKRPEGVDVPSPNGWLPNVDVRASSGYVIAPPSRVIGGGAYTVEDLRAIEEAPPWLVEALNNPYWSDRPKGEKKPFSGHATPYALAVLKGELEAVATCPAGCRNATLNTCAFRLWGWVAGGELAEEEVQAGLEAAAQACGLGQVETLKTIASAKRAGMEHPRNTPIKPEPIQDGNQPMGLRCLNIAEFMAKKYEPRKQLLAPVIQEKSLCMIFGERGTGKTHISLSIALAVACGGDVFGGRWKAPEPATVLFIDGEMPAQSLQERIEALSLGNNYDITDPSKLRIITPDEQLLGVNIDFSQLASQRAIEPFLDGVKLVILDNLACLIGSGKSNSADDWRPVQSWILSLRRRGIAVLLMHHAGKNGDQRGSSAKEDTLDAVVAIRHPKDYDEREGAKFEVRFTKARGIFGNDVDPFEAELIEHDNAYTWQTRPLKEVQEADVKEMFLLGMTVRDIAEELGLSKSTIGRMKKKLEESGELPKHGGRK
ncbi:bifunctional DNA primase/polymerase [Mailhella massiliensis]|uniref:bifunctional DNA primase/polymerase n=1 Tax=Mailhella massiliensis TaxID=1903261 RepID=UPI0009F8F7AF|nr:bifunctional DNA primase/polymerase [Mailhella massiliensis]